MKTIPVLVGSVALIGCGWASATWLHAETVADEYTVSLEALGQRHGVELVSLGYERSLMSSVARTEVHGGLAVSGYGDMLPEAWRKDSRVVLKHVIQHGPLVLEDGVEPLAALVTTTLDLDHLNGVAASGVREACACEEPFRIVSRIQHDGSVTHEWDFMPLSWRDDIDGAPLSLSMGPIDGTLSTSADAKVEARGSLGSVVADLGAFELNYKPTQWTYAGTVSDIPGIGEFEGQSDGLTLSVNGNDTVFRGVGFSSRNTVENGVLGGVARFGIKGVDGATTLGPSSFSMTVRGLSADAVAQFNPKVSQMSLDTVAGRERFLAAYLALVQPGAGLGFDIHTESTQGHSVELTYDMAYAHDTGELATVGDLIGRIDGRLEADLALTWLQDMGLERAIPTVQQTAIVSGDHATLTASLSGGQLTLNDQPFPLDVVFGAVLAQPLPTLSVIAEQWRAAEQAGQR
ncbi:MAG: DUF945 family protein [Pseudomonadota bacterium]